MLQSPPRMPRPEPPPAPVRVRVAEEVGPLLREMREILEGRHDDLPEQAFMMVGTIDEAVSKAQRLASEG